MVGLTDEATAHTSRRGCGGKLPGRDDEGKMVGFGGKRWKTIPGLKTNGKP